LARRQDSAMNSFLLSINSPVFYGLRNCFLVDLSIKYSYLVLTV